MANVLSVLITLLTLSEAIAIRRRAERSTEEIPKVWARINVVGKSTFLAIGLIGLAWGIDRTNLLTHGFVPQSEIRFVVYGLARTSIIMGVAIVAWINMKAFQQLRDTSRKSRVLLLEDDPVACKAMTTILTRAGYTVTAVASVADALSLLDGQDIALLDLMLPDGRGEDVLRAIRQQNRPIRVAIVSACNRDATAPVAWDAWFGKPLDVAALLAWLGETAVAAQENHDAHISHIS